MCFLIGLLLGALSAGIPLRVWARSRDRAATAQANDVGHERDQLAQELAALRAAHAAQRQAHDEHLAHLRIAREDIDRQLKAVCHEALRSSGQQLMELAAQRLGREAAETKHGVSELVAPIASTLQRFDARVGALERQRTEAQAELREQLRTLAGAQDQLLAGTTKLVTALRQPHVRGAWGEQTLRRTLEMAGLVEHVDFCEQPTIGTPDGPQRPDVVINLPGDRCCVIDSKVPLEHYLQASTTDDHTARRELLAKHAAVLRRHLKQLDSKRYWAALPNTPEFVFLFLPSDQILNAALRADSHLLTEVADRRVFIATPMTLMALLRVVAITWRQERIAQNAKEIWQLGRDLHHRIAKLSDRLNTLGRRLESTVGAYNETVGSYESRVLPSARRLGEAGVAPGSAQLPVPEQITKAPRALPAPASASVVPAEDEARAA